MGSTQPLEAYQADGRGLLQPTRALSTAIGKFERGDSVTDRELSLLIGHFKQLEAGLRAMGPRFDLARVDVYRSLLRAEEYQMNRQKKVGR